MGFHDDPTNVSTGLKNVDDVPRTPPKACPECGRKFSQVIKPKRRLQNQAKLIIVFGACLTIVWAPVVWLSFWAILAAIGIVIAPLFVVIIPFLIICLPAYAAGVFALRLPCIVQLACRDCSWSRLFVVDKKGQIVSGSESQDQR